MNNTTRKTLGNSLFALAATVLLGASAANANDREEALWSSGFWWVTDPIEGLWDVRVTITNCATGTPIPGASFDSMGLFVRGGAFHDTTASAMSSPAARSSSFGTWRHVRGRTYQFAFKVFRFDSASQQPIGWQIVRHTLTLARDGKSYTSAGTSEAFDPNGNPLAGPPTGCSTSTATRFK